MNSEEKVKVKNLLKDRPDLISEYLWNERMERRKIPRIVNIKYME